MKLRYLRLYAVDSKGRVVPDFIENISIDVQGAATLRTLDNGDHHTDELFHENHILMHKGFALATLCSNQSPGKLVFKANAKGLKGISLNLETK